HFFSPSSSPSPPGRSDRLSLAGRGPVRVGQRSVVSRPLSISNLDDASVEMPLWRGSGDVLQQTNQNIAGLVRLNNRIHPAARRAVPDVGLFFVTLLHFYAELFQFFVYGLFVTSLPCAGENRKNSIRCLGRAHHGVARSWPGDNKTRV